MFRFVRFNTFLSAALVLLLAAGCKSDHPDDAKKDDKDKKEATVLELHMEADLDGTSDIGTVTVGHGAASFKMNVDKNAFVDNGDLDTAEVVDTPDGLFAIRLKFKRRGVNLLDTYTSSNPGKRVAVFCQFGSGKEHNRFIAAPALRKPLSNGIFEFTPDVTREEADRIVRGLNKVAEQIKKDDTFP